MMNEQVQKLAAKAEIHYHRCGKAQQDMERFTKVIVQECANIDFRHALGLSGDQAYEVSELIRKHFGVE